MTYYIYMLRCADGSFYTGLTTDLKRRVREHVSGKHRRAFTYSRRPVELVWFEAVEGKDEAKRREKQVKGLKRPQKEALAEAHQAAAQVRRTSEVRRTSQAG